jgi:hypothetical protein
LSFQKNSTLQHYDAIEIIAHAAENCACMFVIVKDLAKRPRWPPRFSQRPDLYHPQIVLTTAASRGESLVRISH